MKITLRGSCIIAPLVLLAGLLAYETEPPIETVKILGKERVITQRPDGTRSVDLSDTPISMMVSRVSPNGKTESRCLGSQQEKIAFENFTTNAIGSDK